MAHAKFTKTFDADCQQLFAVICDYKKYPDFVQGCLAAQVKRKSDHTAEVTYRVSMIKEIEYILSHVEKPDEWVMSWKLKKSDFLKKNTGQWKLKKLGASKTQVEYEIEIDFILPVPQFIVNRIIKNGLPQLMENFETRAQAGK